MDYSAQQDNNQWNDSIEARVNRVVATAIARFREEAFSQQLKEEIGK